MLTPYKPTKLDLFELKYYDLISPSSVLKDNDQQEEKDVILFLIEGVRKKVRAAHILHGNETNKVDIKYPKDIRNKLLLLRYTEYIKVINSPNIHNRFGGLMQDIENNYWWVKHCCKPNKYPILIKNGFTEDEVIQLLSGNDIVINGIRERIYEAITKHKWVLPKEVIKFYKNELNLLNGLNNAIEIPNDLPKEL